MKNAVGREIPEEILKITGKEPFQGNNYLDGKVITKAGPSIRPVMNNETSKLVTSIKEALVKCGAHDGMTVSFHHHFREGDLIVNMVMKEIHNMGFKNIRRSHGGRVRSITTGESHIDIAFIGAPTSDDYGNLRGIGGKADCGVLSYAIVDGNHADYCVAITDCLVPYPNFPAHISQTKIDYVCVVDEIGVPSKIATGAAKPTTDQRKLLMAQYCTDVVVNTPWFKDGFSYQTGVGGASIASTMYLAEIMRERNIHMGFGVGGLTKAMCQLLDEGMARTMLDVQDFDLDAVSNLKSINHHRIAANVYANPMNKGAVVNKLDYVVLASLEVDVHFNCNVVVGSDGMITGAQGGHPDTAQGAKCAIVICPLMQGRIPAICSDVTTVTTPGESIDVVVTDYGVAVNPARKDILESLERSGAVPLVTIEELRDIAYSIVGEPEKVQFEDRVVGIIEARDGTIMDVVRQIKEYE